MLRKCAVLLLILTAASAGAVQLPLKINFQGKLLSTGSNAPVNQSVNFTFAICNDPSATCVPCASNPSVCLWTETQNSVSVSNGVFAVELGSATALSPSLFAGASTYLSITTSLDSGEMTPRQQLVMSPYSFTAAQLVQNGNISINPGTAYSTFTTLGDLQLAGSLNAASGVFSASLTASSGTFTDTGASQYSLQTSSGIDMANGVLTAPSISIGGGTASGTVYFNSASDALDTNNQPGIYVATNVIVTGSSYVGIGTTFPDAPLQIEVPALGGTTSPLIDIDTGTSNTQNILDVYGNGTAILAGGLTASSGTFTAKGANQYSLVTSSGIDVQAGSVVLNSTVSLGSGGTPFAQLLTGTCALAATACTRSTITAFGACTATGVTSNSMVFGVPNKSMGANLTAVILSITTNSFTVGCLAGSTNSPTSTAATFNWTAIIP